MPEILEPVPGGGTATSTRAPTVTTGDATDDDVRLSNEDLRERVADLARRASHDELTGLANRSLLFDRLEHALERSRRSVSECVLLFIDIDHFKVVNDSLGHAAGDELLRAVADRLRSCCREADTLGRLGGDEFLVICEDTDVAHAETVADRIAAELREPITLGTRRLVVSVSIGIAGSGLRDHDPGRLFRDADTALYLAKDLGRGRHAVFTEATHRQAVRRLELEARLREALAADVISVRYQPQVELLTGRVVGAEALLHWEAPDGTVIERDEFLPVAEETGLITELGRRALEDACRCLAGWRSTLRAAPRSVTVHVSAHQLIEATFADEVRDCLRRNGLEPRRLCLELAEDTLRAGGDAARQTLDRLQGLGVYLSIDDFGTGYSSLARLRDLPFEVLKIDRGFVSGLGGESADLAVISSIMSLAHAMGLHVIAEGIEHHRQAAALVELGCLVAAGPALSPCLAPEELAGLVASPPAGLRALAGLRGGTQHNGLGPGGRHSVRVDDPPARARLRFIDEFMYQLGAPGTSR